MRFIKPRSNISRLNSGTPPGCKRLQLGSELQDQELRHYAPDLEAEQVAGCRRYRVSFLSCPILETLHRTHCQTRAQRWIQNLLVFPAESCDRKNGLIQNQGIIMSGKYRAIVLPLAGLVVTLLVSCPAATLTVPESPSSLLVTNATSASLTLAWGTVADGDVLPAVAGESSRWPVPAGVQRHCEPVHGPGPTSSTTYYYKVRAQNTIGLSDDTGPVAGTTAADAGGTAGARRSHGQ